MSDIFDILDELAAPTDYTRSFVPARMAEGPSTNAEKRTFLLGQLRRARKVGMGISTVQILISLRSTVCPARIWELQQEGWCIENKGKCADGSDLYVLVSEEQGPPVVKLLGWEGSLSTTGVTTKSHAHAQALTEDERLILDRYMAACLRSWIVTNKPEWARSI